MLLLGRKVVSEKELLNGCLTLVSFSSDVVFLFLLLAACDFDWRLVYMTQVYPFVKLIRNTYCVTLL